MNTQDAIEHLQRYPSDTPVCFILWLPQDVIDRAKEQGITLNREQAGEILESLYENHDCNYGITWETIDVQLDGFVKDQKDSEVDDPTESSDLENLLNCSIEELTVVKHHKYEWNTLARMLSEPSFPIHKSTFEALHQQLKDLKTDLFTDGENHFTVADGAGTNYRLWSVTMPSD